MQNSLTLTKSFTINAPKSKVWEALTNPEIIKQYFFGTNTVTDWKVGSPIYFRGEWDGKAYEDKGTVLANEFQKLIKYNYWSSFSTKPDAPENYANITYLLEEKSGVTTFMIKQDNIENEEALKHSESNWAMVMDGMKKLVEAGL
jgi:uncharacterized protein YndB with AHSA1/START domain